jgi:hypothetical protein
MKHTAEHFHLIPFFLLFLFSIIALFALFQPGLWTAHDIWHQVARLYWYRDATLHGQFPPFFIPQLANGYGYPLFVFSYHFPWLLSLPFLFLHVPFDIILKGLFFTSFFVSGIGMYLFLFSITKQRLSSFVGAFFYLWAPQHFVTIFVSAALGVSFLWAGIPFIFLGMFLIYRNHTLGKFLFPLSITMCLLSHFMTLVFFTPFLLGFFLILFYRHMQRFSFLRDLFLFGLLGIGISAFSFLPTLYYSHSILGFPAGLYETGLLSFRQILYSPWGYGIIQHSAFLESPFSFQLGIAHWVGILFSFLTFLFILFRNRSFIHPLLYGFSFLSVAFCVFLSITQSFFIWKWFISFLPLDYPFRFLIPLTFFCLPSDITFFVTYTLFGSVFLCDIPFGFVSLCESKSYSC